MFPIMLPTGKKPEMGDILADTPGIPIGLCTNINYTASTIKPHYLYIVSAREIKMGDWRLDKKTKQLLRHNGSFMPKWANDYYWKVEATTDKSLKLKEYSTVLSCCHGGKTCDCFLPQVPKSFMEKYVKIQGKIYQIEVEIETIFIQDYAATPNSPLPPLQELSLDKIKTNYNNEIIIHTYK